MIPETPNVSAIPTPPGQALYLFYDWFFLALAIAFFLLRVWARVSGRLWGLDDWLLSGALLFSILMCVTTYYFVKILYMGYPPEMAPPPEEINIIAVNYYAYLFELFYNPILALVKASVLIFLLRLGGHRQSIRYAILGLNTVNAMLAVAVFIVTLLKCIPIDASWDITKEGKCVDTVYYLITAVITVITDILVLALPFWIFLGLKMKTGMKAAIIGIFTVGIGVTVVSVVRVAQLVETTYFPERSDKDFPNIGPFLAHIEANLAIVSACLPALRPLFKRWMPGVLSSGGASKSRQYGMSGSRPLGGSQIHHVGAGKGGSGYNIQLRSLNDTRRQHTVCRSDSPTGSENEIMTYNGIMRKTDVEVDYSDMNMDASSQQSDSMPRYDPKHLA